jgi:hypothetical protein
MRASRTGDPVIMRVRDPTELRYIPHNMNLVGRGNSQSSSTQLRGLWRCRNQPPPAGPALTGLVADGPAVSDPRLAALMHSTDDDLIEFITGSTARSSTKSATIRATPASANRGLEHAGTRHRHVSTSIWMHAEFGHHDHVPLAVPNEYQCAVIDLSDVAGTQLNPRPLKKLHLERVTKIDAATRGLVLAASISKFARMHDYCRYSGGLS